MRETGLRAIGALLVLLTFLWLIPSVGDAFEFGLIGDQQYNKKSKAKFPPLMSDLNQADLAFVVHIGDFKGGRRGVCSDEAFSSRKADFEASKHPFIYTPGDNDWTDCHQPKTGRDPMERLAKLRKLFFQGEQSLGQRKLTLTRQSNDPNYAKFRENVRWSYEEVLFVTLHMVGSNNNLGRTPETDAEYKDRNAANLVWLKQAFDLAKRDGSKAIALFTHPNPRFENRLLPRRLRMLQINPTSKKPSGYSDFLAALEDETVAFGKPVVLMHGDSHTFRVDKPMFDRLGKRGQVVENFTRVETFGFPDSHWVRVIVDPKDPNVFTFKQGIVKKNVGKHSFK